MDYEPNVTRTEKALGIFVLVTFLCLIVIAIYCLSVWLASGLVVLVLSASVVVIGGLLCMATVLLVDLRRRGGYAARAMRKLRANEASRRLAAVKELEFIGTSAARMRETVQRRGGLGSGMMLWEYQRELDKYVLPGLTQALNDQSAVVRSSAIAALLEVATPEAMVAVASAERR